MKRFSFDKDQTIDEQLDSNSTENICYAIFYYCDMLKYPIKEEDLEYGEDYKLKQNQYLTACEVEAKTILMSLENQGFNKIIDPKLKVLFEKDYNYHQQASEILISLISLWHEEIDENSDIPRIELSSLATQARQIKNSLEEELNNPEILLNIHFNMISSELTNIVKDSENELEIANSIITGQSKPFDTDEELLNKITNVLENIKSNEARFKSLMEHGIEE